MSDSLARELVGVLWLIASYLASGFLSAVFVFMAIVCFIESAYHAHQDRPTSNKRGQE